MASYHLARMITNGSIGTREEIVEEHVAGLFGLFGGRGLVVGDFVQRNKQEWLGHSNGNSSRERARRLAEPV